MSYATAETALETILKTVSGYSATNVKKGDDRVLGSGQAKAIIIRPGPFTREISPPGVINNSWQIKLELYIPYRGEVLTFWDSIRTERQNILDTLDTYFTLDKSAGVIYGGVESGDEPELLQIGSNLFWWQVMRVTIREITTVAYAE